ncbi:hypothetical protein [Nocardia sp. NPDC127526]|uniref:hypothetical protein n=1 Tax=Nocardia sp. NPDC127526 TaxID=3345393 RepID=UPI003633FB68
MAESQLVNALVELGRTLAALEGRTRTALAGISDPETLYWKLIAVDQAATDLAKAADQARLSLLDTGDFALDAARLVARVQAAVPEVVRSRIGAADPDAVPPDPGE